MGDRWWLLLVMWAGVGLLAYAADRVTAGNSFGMVVAWPIATTLPVIGQATGQWDAAPGRFVSA